MTDEQKEKAQSWLGLTKEYDHQITFRFIGIDDNGDLVNGSNGRFVLTLSTDAPLSTYEEVKQHLKGQKLDWGWFEEDGSWFENENEFWEVIAINDTEFTITDNKGTDGIVSMTDIIDIVTEKGTATTSVEIDKTLTVENAAAEAKVVGEKLAEKVGFDNLAYGLRKVVGNTIGGTSRTYEHLKNENSNYVIAKGSYVNAFPHYVKQSLTDMAYNTNTLTDEEKATACEWLGASGKLYKHNISFYGYIEPGGGDLEGNFNITFQKLSTRKEAYEGITNDIFNGINFLYITDWSTAEFEIINGETGSYIGNAAIDFYYLPLRIEYIEYDIEDENGNKYIGVDVVPLTAYSPPSTLYTNQEFKYFTDVVEEIGE